MKLIKDLGVIDGRRKGIYECSSCGKHIERRTSHVKASKTTECQACLMSKKFKIHGDTGTRLHNIWLQMRLRCTDTNNPAYRWYGAKGIKVVEEWETYETFKDWAINNKYTEELTIERVDSDKNYEPSNCRWITKSENTARSNTEKPRNLSKNTYIITSDDGFYLETNNIAKFVRDYIGVNTHSISCYIRKIVKEKIEVKYKNYYIKRKD